MLRLVEFGEIEIWGGVADIQYSRPRPQPKRFKGKNQEGNRSRDFGHYPTKLLRRTPHHAVQCAADAEPKHSDNAQDGKRNSDGRF